MSTQQPANLAEMVRERAKSRGSALVYEFEGRQTTFAEFDIKTNRVANALIALGVKPRERIAYLGKNSDIYFELLLGAMKANVVMAPVNWRLAGPEVHVTQLAAGRRRHPAEVTHERDPVRAVLAHDDVVEVHRDVRVEVGRALDLVEQLRGDGVDADQAAGAGVLGDH